MGEAGHSDDRFNQTVKRIGAEAFWLHTYQSAIDSMKRVDAIGLDFFRVSLNALKDARLIRLIRALEDDSQTASFWTCLSPTRHLSRRPPSLPDWISWNCERLPMHCG
jgi:hypothetical protein